MSASYSNRILTKPEAVGQRRSAGTAKKARRPREMAGSEPRGGAAKEWEQLEPAQKNLYKEVMLENNSNPAPTENQDPKPDMICKLEKGEKLQLRKRKKNKQSNVNQLARPRQTGASGKEIQQDEEQKEENQKSQSKLIKEDTLKKKISTSKKSNIVAHTCNPSTWEAESGRL